MMGAGLLSSTWLGVGTLIGRAQVLPVVALDEDRSPKAVFDWWTSRVCKLPVTTQNFCNTKSSFTWYKFCIKLQLHGTDNPGHVKFAPKITRQYLKLFLANNITK